MPTAPPGFFGANVEPNIITQNPGDSLKIKAPAISLGRYVGLLVAAWTGLIILSLAVNLYQESQTPDLRCNHRCTASHCF